MRLRNKRITLLVTGSIAAYKSAELVREFSREGASVRVALTESAAQFITPLTLQTLSGYPVATDLFNLQEESEIGHIRLADEADLVVLAPASATTIAKAAHGIADNIVTAVLLATRAPVVCAPAMNVNMWNHPATKESCAKLAGWGWHFVNPGEGHLACGWQGQGRLAEKEEILFAAERALSVQDLAGRRIVVTAGATREFLDPVRCMTNRSSGKMGYAIAERASIRGGDVVLVSGPSAVTPPLGVEVRRVETALEMRAELDRLLGEFVGGREGANSALIMAAAVTDFRPSVQSREKLKQSKDEENSVVFAPNPDILKAIGERREREFCHLSLVGFAAESGAPEEIIRLGKEKLERKKLDLVVANSVDTAFEGDVNRVWLISGNRVVEVEEAPKREVADRLLDALKEISPMAGRQ